MTSASRPMGYSESEATVRARLADDPWANDMLTIESVEPWSVWLCAATLRGLR